MEDYTNKYKGEQVEVALFGGEYQEGVLTAYCSIEDVPHIELNGHILVPLQNVASLHCSSRCDAPEPDWPPRGLSDDREDETKRASAVRRRALNVLKAWLLSRSCRALRRGRLAARRSRAASLFVFCALLAALAIYAYADRALIGMLGARPYALAEDPILPSTGTRLASQVGVLPPKLYLIRDGFPRAFWAGEGPKLGAGGLDRAARRAAPAELEGVLAHELAHVRSATSSCRRSLSCSP